MNLLSSDLQPTKYAPADPVQTTTTALGQILSDALAILQLLQEEALTRFPAFPEAFGALKWTAAPDCADIFCHRRTAPVLSSAAPCAGIS